MINDKTDNHSCVSTTTEKNNFLCACACVNKNIEISNSNCLFYHYFFKMSRIGVITYTVADLPDLPQEYTSIRDFRVSTQNQSHVVLY